MDVLELSINDIKPYDKNPRNNKGAIDAVASSIREFGWQQPIVVDENGVIIVGHTRYEAAKALGLETVPVKVAEGLSDAQVRAYRLADNKVGELAEWDESLLAEELSGIAEMADGISFDMGDFGFSGFGTDEGKEGAPKAFSEKDISDKFNPKDVIVLEFDSEAELESAYERLSGEGYRCRLLTL